MKRMASFIGVLVPLILLPAPTQAEPVGRITHIENNVDITSPGQIARPAHIGTEVYRDDIICTRSRAKAEIIFPGATIIRIAQKTRVEISDYMAGNGMRTGVMCLFRVKIISVVSEFFRMASFSSRNPREVPYTAIAGVR